MGKSFWGPEHHVTAVQRCAPRQGMVCSDAVTPPPQIAAHVWLVYCENGQTGGRTTHTIKDETNKKMLDTFKATVTMRQRRNRC